MKMCSISLSFIKTYEISHFIFASTCHGSAKDRTEEVTHEPLHAVDPVNLGNDNNDNDNDNDNVNNNNNKNNNDNDIIIKYITHCGSRQPWHQKSILRADQLEKRQNCGNLTNLKI